MSSPTSVCSGLASQINSHQTFFSGREHSNIRYIHICETCRTLLQSSLV